MRCDPEPTLSPTPGPAAAHRDPKSGLSPMVPPGPADDS
jgi:hypothetical protein